MLQVRRDETVDGSAVDSRLPQPLKHAPTVIGAVASAPELQFRELMGILHRRGRLVVTIALVGTILAAVIGLLSTPKYTATAQLIVDRSAAGRDRAGGAGSGESIETHVILVTARDHLQRVIDRLPHDAPERKVAPQTAGSLSTEGNGTPSSASNQPVGQKSILRKFADHLDIWIGALSSGGNRTGPTIEQFLRDTRAIQEGRSRVITVAYTSADPAKAAEFVNLSTRLYVENLVEQRLESASSEIARLQERIAEAKSAMERAGIAVQGAIQQRLEAERSGGGPEADQQLYEIERQAATSAQLYGSLLRRQKELHDQQESVGAGVAIHSVATVPNRPSSHNPILFILPAFLVFAIGASGLAVVLEKLDRGLRSERATAEALGMPCISLAPKLTRQQLGKLNQQLVSEPFSAYVEAIRLAVANLRLVESTCTSKVLLVSSSVPGEGKTTFAMSLAGYLARLERNVLLVNLDRRQESGPEAFDPSIDENIVEQAQNRAHAKLIKRLPELGIDCLSMPGQRLDPLTRFTREEIPRLLDELRKEYDLVIIDGPPVLGVAETRLLCSMVDQLIFVVKWGSTTPEVAQNALTLLRDFGCLDKQCDDLAVAVLTQVDLKKHALYRYGDVGDYLGKASTATRR